MQRQANRIVSQPQKVRFEVSQQRRFSRTMRSDDLTTPLLGKEIGTKMIHRNTSGKNVRNRARLDLTSSEWIRCTVCHVVVDGSDKLPSRNG